MASAVGDDDEDEGEDGDRLRPVDDTAAVVAADAAVRRCWSVVFVRCTEEGRNEPPRQLDVCLRVRCTRRNGVVWRGGQRGERRRWSGMLMHERKKLLSSRKIEHDDPAELGTTAVAAVGTDAGEFGANRQSLRGSGTCVAGNDHRMEQPVFLASRPVLRRLRVRVISYFSR